MTEELEVLVEMQKKDDRIGKYEHQLKILPEELSSLKQTLAEANAALEETESNLTENLKSQKKLELEIEDNKQRIDKYKNQLLSIKTNKEYKALNGEINHLETKNSDIDDKLIALMEEESNLREEKEKRLEAKRSAEQELKANEKRLEDKIAALQKEIERLKEQRNEYGRKLPFNLLRKYAGLIKNKNRKAVVHCSGEVCGGCGFSIRPQLIIELKEGKSVLYCENCGRIMVYIPAEDKE
jgi:hypothetical protein